MTEARQTKQLDKVVNSYKPIANHAFNKMHQVSRAAVIDKLQKARVGCASVIACVVTFCYTRLRLPLCIHPKPYKE